MKKKKSHQDNHDKHVFECFYQTVFSVPILGSYLLLSFSKESHTMPIEFWVAAARGEEQYKASSLGQPNRVDVNRGFIHSYVCVIIIYWGNFRFLKNWLFKGQCPLIQRFLHQIKAMQKK